MNKIHSLCFFLFTALTVCGLFIPMAARVKLKLGWLTTLSLLLLDNSLVLIIILLDPFYSPIEFPMLTFCSCFEAFQCVALNWLDKYDEKIDAEIEREKKYAKELDREFEKLLLENRRLRKGNKES